MDVYQHEFVEFMVRADVLTFGDFTTKSGRRTPFFINTGRYRTGDQLNQLARYYADAIIAQGIEFDFLFGPAYKGIPLVTAVSMELARRGRNVPFCFNRKEVKDHGEGGSLVGHGVDETTLTTTAEHDLTIALDADEFAEESDCVELAAVPSAGAYSTGKSADGEADDDRSRSGSSQSAGRS